MKKLLNPLVLPDYITAFTPRSNIVKNAEFHTHKDVVMCIDIKDFFPSIGAGRVFKIFENLGYKKDICHLLTTLTTHKGRLIQGAPTSPALANLALLNMDRGLKKVADKFEFTYTRYADDLIFSGNNMNKKAVYKMLSIAKSFIKSNKLQVNEVKTKVYWKTGGQIVTGLVVNNGVELRKRWLRRVDRLFIWLLEGKQIIESQAQVEGLISFINMVNPGYAKVLKHNWKQIKKMDNFNKLFNRMLDSEERIKQKVGRFIWELKDGEY